MPLKTTFPSGFLLASASAVFYAAVSLGVFYWSEQLTVSGVLFLRGLAGLLVLSGLACWKRRFRPKRWERPGLLALIGLSGVLSSICLTGALMTIPIYQALALHYLYPALTAALAALLGQAVIGRREIFLILLAIAGALVTIWPEGARLARGLAPGHLLAFGGGLLYSASLVMSRLWNTRKPINFLAPLWLYSAWALLVPLGLNLFSESALISSRASLAAGLFLGLLCALALGTAYTALKYWPAHKVGVVGLLEVVICTLASFILFKTPFSLKALLGAAMVVMAAAWLSRPKSAGLN